MCGKNSVPVFKPTTQIVFKKRSFFPKRNDCFWKRLKNETKKRLLNDRFQKRLTNLCASCFLSFKNNKIVTCNTLLDLGKLQNIEDILPSTRVPFQENKLKSNNDKFLMSLSSKWSSKCGGWVNLYNSNHVKKEWDILLRNINFFFTKLFRQTVYDQLRRNNFKFSRIFASVINIIHYLIISVSIHNNPFWVQCIHPVRLLVFSAHKITETCLLKIKKRIIRSQKFLNYFKIKILS